MPTSTRYDPADYMTLRDALSLADKLENRIAELEAALREISAPFTFTNAGELLNEFNRRQGIASKALSPKR